MKRLLRIFDLSKNEQRVVLIVMFLLVAIAFVGYERRVRHRSVATDSAPFPTPVEAGQSRHAPLTASPVNTKLPALPEPTG